MGKPVVHFEVVGKDGKKLQKFYGDLFDWKMNTDNPMNYGMVDNAGDGINGGIGPNPQGQSYATFYVQVDDLRKALDKIESLGGKTVTQPMDLPGGNVSIAMFNDPSGNLIGLAKGM